METNLLDFVKEIVEIIVALVGVLVLLRQYFSQKQKEHLERIIENKRKAYSQFLNRLASDLIDADYERLQLRTIDEDKQLSNTLNLLLVYGNDPVLKAYKEWNNALDMRKEENNAQAGNEEFGNLLLEIRKDIQRDTKLTVKDIANLPLWIKLTK